MRWNALAVISDIGSLRIDLADGLVVLDARAARHFRLPSEAAVLSIDSWLSRLSGTDRARIARLVHSGLRPDNTEIEIVRLRWLPEHGSSILELSLRASPEAKKVAGLCRDVTNSRALEEARLDRIAGEDAEFEKGEFLSQVSHELRTPLNSILGFAQLMAMDVDQPLAPKQRERLQMIRNSSHRLLGVVDQYLQIGMIKPGQLTLRLRPVHIHGLVRRCVDALAPMAEEHAVVVEVDLLEGETSAVNADPDALEQVLVNLLSNGIKYNRKGGRLIVRYEAEEDGCLTVEDTGTGLTVSQIARFSEPFDGSQAKSKGVQGAGLGLAISRKLVEEMHGSLHLWSKLGVGSRVRVTLPLARGPRAADGETADLDIALPWAASKRFRVLYIEDDEVNIVLMQQLFSTHPAWELTVAMSGAAGLAEAARLLPAVILLDLGLPDMTGWEVQRRLKADVGTQDLPVVAVSADAMPASVKRSRAVGFEDYWTKPLNLPATIEWLKAACSMATLR